MRVDNREAASVFYAKAEKVPGLLSRSKFYKIVASDLDD